MARSVAPSQQKLAEKLLILNDRGLGMLTRIYNIKKVNIYNNTHIYKHIHMYAIFLHSITMIES